MELGEGQKMKLDSEVSVEERTVGESSVRENPR